jgi:hypothetical protein
MKKMSNRKTISVIPDMLKLVLILFLGFRSINHIVYSTGSLSRSMNSVVLASNW